MLIGQFKFQARQPYARRAWNSDCTASWTAWQVFPWIFNVSAGRKMERDIFSPREKRTETEQEVGEGEGEIHSFVFCPSFPFFSRPIFRAAKTSRIFHVPRTETLATHASDFCKKQTSRFSKVPSTLVCSLFVIISILLTFGTYVLRNDGRRVG